jgi:hypothetical protein
MSGGQAGWFDQFYEPESLVEQLADNARWMVPSLYGHSAEELHGRFDGADPELEGAHDLTDQLRRALRFALLAQLRRVGKSQAAPQNVAGLPCLLVNDAVERCRSLIVYGEPGRHYPARRALRLDDMGTGWSMTVGVRELADWVAHERLTDWVGSSEPEWRRRLANGANTELDPVGAAALLGGRRVLCVHVEQGDHPRLEHGYEQAEMCLDDGSLLLLDAKDSTWVGEDTDLTVSVDGTDQPDVPSVLHGLIGQRIGSAESLDPPAGAAFAIRLRVDAKSIVISASGDGASIGYWEPLIPFPASRVER